MKVLTQSVDFTADKKLLQFIELKLAKLEVFFDRIINASVTLKLDTGGRLGGKVAEVRLNVPGSVFYVKESSGTFESSIDIAIVALKRQLLRYKERISKN